MTTRSDAKRLVCILGVMACMVAIVLLVGTRLSRSDHGRHRLAEPVSSHWDSAPLLQDPRAALTPDEVTRSHTFAHRPTTLPPDLQVDPTRKSRDLASYYARRAFIGAPPHIPHEVSAENSLAQSCNVCHEKGGYVPKWNAYAPVTPHPTYSNCTQCHVEAKTDSVFVETTFTAPPPPDLHRPALPGNPPPIPHRIELRQDCLSCHAGPHAPPEIRTSHPERLNCRQCHTPHETDRVFTRDGEAAPVVPDVGVERLLLDMAAAQAAQAEQAEQERDDP